MSPHTVALSELLGRTVRDGGVSIGTFLFEFNTTGIARIAA